MRSLVVTRVSILMLPAGTADPTCHVTRFVLHKHEIKQCHILQVRIQALAEEFIQCNTYELLTLLQDTHVPIMQRQLTVRLGEMHAHYYISSMHYSWAIHDARKT